MPLDRIAEFPWTAAGSPIYCNAASTGPIPRRTRDLLDHWSVLRAEPWRITLEDQFGALRTARSRCAALIGAEADEIALVPNTSTGINVAAQILPVRAGQTILGHDGEFPANVYPWMARARASGARFEQLPLRDDGLPAWDAVPGRIARGDVAILAISWVSFVSGDRADLHALGALCRAHDVRFVVDGIQGVGTTPLDVHACNVDVLACGAQKWLLSPWGSGFCYVRRELITRSDPVMVGWLAMQGSEDFSRMLDYDFTYYDDARRFEVATIPYQDMAGMNASLELLAELGLDEVSRAIASLVGQLVEGIADMDGVALVTPRDPNRRAGIVSVRVGDATIVSRALDAAGVVHSLRGRGVLRFSPHVYNTADEMDRILAVLRESARG
jgi:selenocysteine lyase/cysteine desulfurase